MGHWGSLFPAKPLEMFVSLGVALFWGPQMTKVQYKCEERTFSAVGHGTRYHSGTLRPTGLAGILGIQPYHSLLHRL